MLGCLILAILAGFIAVDIIRSRPKPQPKVAKEETLKCDNPEPEIPAPEEAPKETLKRDKPELAIPAPEEAPKEIVVCPNCKRELNKKYFLSNQGMCVYCVIHSQMHGKPEEASKETSKYDEPKPASSVPKGLQEWLKWYQGLSPGEQERCKQRAKVEQYLCSDKLGGVGSLMIHTVQDNYRGYISDMEMQHPPETHYLRITDSIIMLDELYSSSKGQQLGVKPKYIGTLKKFLQSSVDNDLSTAFAYLAALHYIYFHLLLETNPNRNMKLKLLDDAELYRIFKDSVHRNIDYLRKVSYGEAELDHCTLYEFTEKIDKMFRFAFEQRKLSVPE